MFSTGYSGKQPNYTSYVKTFSSPSLINYVTWTNKTLNGQSVLTPTNGNVNVYVPNDLIVGGSINNPSDIKLKENIQDIDSALCDKLLKIAPKQYNYISDNDKKTHFGVIAQDLEACFPNLVRDVSLENNGKIEEHKVVNYIELVPLLLFKIQDLQKQIDELAGNRNASLPKL